MKTGSAAEMSSLPATVWHRPGLHGRGVLSVGETVASLRDRGRGGGRGDVGSGKTVVPEPHGSSMEPPTSILSSQTRFRDMRPHGRIGLETIEREPVRGLFHNRRNSCRFTQSLSLQYITS